MYSLLFHQKLSIPLEGPAALQDRSKTFDECFLFHVITGRHYFQNQAGFDKQILSYVYICLLLAEVSLQLKILPRNIYKNKCREDEIDTIFNSPCLFTSNSLIQFQQLMLVYEEHFNTVQIAHACLRKIFQCGRVYLHFTYNDIYICHMHSPHLISIIKCQHRHPELQYPLTATLPFEQQFVLDETALPTDLIRFSSHPCLLV